MAVIVRRRSPGEAALLVAFLFQHGNPDAAPFPTTAAAIVRAGVADSAKDDRIAVICNRISYWCGLSDTIVATATLPVATW
jgi:hypothetical protein